MPPVPDDSFITNSAFPKDEEGNFYTSFELPKYMVFSFRQKIEFWWLFCRVYYQKLQTSTDFDIKVLSETTETKISFPKCDQEGKLKIVGHTEEDLKKALIELYSIIGFIREKNIALQFAAIPLLSKEIQSNFEKFKVILFERPIRVNKLKRMYIVRNTTSVLEILLIIQKTYTLDFCAVFWEG